MNQAYRVLSEEETIARGINERYSVLVGPEGFECFLGEPEDCTWKRDGRTVVAELNNLYNHIRLTQWEKENEPT